MQNDLYQAAAAARVFQTAISAGVLPARASQAAEAAVTNGKAYGLIIPRDPALACFVVTTEDEMRLGLTAGVNGVVVALQGREPMVQ